MRWYPVCAVFAAGSVGACGAAPASHVDGADPGEYGPAAATSRPADPSATGGSGDPAAPGAPCLQGTLRSCVVPLAAQGGVHNCFSGKQLCTGGAWTDCQDLAALVGTRAQQFVASCPATLVPRWTTLDYSVDAPDDASGDAAVTVVLAGHPDIVLLDTRASDSAPAKGGAGSRDVLALLGSFASGATLTLEVATSTTPDGVLASTATLSPRYGCVASSVP